ncbi:glutamate-rich WD repeat-containing protein [Hysterangium stoloniferum]|nr:glutamate-rich WD repeat-containing protein [Hysterangium stoloniferum]
MSKRSATEQRSPPSKTHASGNEKPESHRQNGDTNEMGEFEDAWEDEIESDEEIVEESGEKGEGGEDGMEIDGDILPAVEEEDAPQPLADTYIPGKYKLSKDEILEPDQSVYIALHSMTVYWPCLSFDILRDNLGDERSRFPATAYAVAGTQADVAKNNEVLVMKMSQLHRTQKDDDSDDGEEDDDDENLDEDAVLEYRSIPHLGGVNRVRAQPFPIGQQLPPVTDPYYISTWADTGKVHIYDVRSLLESLATPGFVPDKARSSSPIFTVTAHGRAEGFAMDWASSGSNASGLRLLSGDIQSKIYLTTSTPSGFNTLPQPFTSHTSSVEDLQWSPAEPTVFASCSADRSIRIWDVRVRGRKSAIALEAAHDNDVNVISWNKNTTYLLLSGGDEGGIKAWDLRNFKESSERQPSPAASFAWHEAPITSIEWHPTEDSIFAASGADEQVTLWDLSVEHDEDEGGINEDSQGGKDVPPQLLFVHQGQKDIKELHWHPQMPGAVVTTASDGFNFFKTISV